MSARADFWCMICDELMELPLKAAACPVCGGLLERRFTPPMVNTDFGKKVDAIADPVLAPMPSTPPQVDPKLQTRTNVGLAPALGMVPAVGRIASNQLNTAVLKFAAGKGPRPVPGI